MKRFPAKAEESVGTKRLKTTYTSRAARIIPIFATPSSPATNQNGHCALESLPPEVRRHLLSLMDLHPLKALVRASPVFHEQYLSDRRFLLCRSLEQTLSTASIDAYALHMLTVHNRDPKAKLQEYFPQFLKSYSENTLRHLSPLSEATLDEALSISVFYLRSVRPVMEYYACWGRNNLLATIPNSLRRSLQYIAFTNMEILRLTRAIYRFELLCQMVYAGRKPHPGSPWARLRGMLNILEPWEIEELFSFYQFVHFMYDKIFDTIYWDVNPKFSNQDGFSTPEGTFELGGRSKLGFSPQMLILPHEHYF